MSRKANYTALPWLIKFHFVLQIPRPPSYLSRMRFLSAGWCFHLMLASRYIFTIWLTYFCFLNAEVILNIKYFKQLAGVESSIYWTTAPCGQSQFNQSSGGTCLHFKCGRISQVSNQLEAGIEQSNRLAKISVYNPKLILFLFFHCTALYSRR
jgi:hypothetical protein